MKKYLVLMAMLFSLPANAQQQPDAAFLQRVLAALQAQRNHAQDTAAEREAQLMNELAKAMAKVKELESNQK